MHSIQNNARPLLYGKVSWKTGSLGSGNQSKIDLIRKADTIDFLIVAKQYGLNIDEYNHQITCPFKFHNDKTPSFKFYPDKNSFYCFGCKNYGKAVNFIALYEDISRIEAASKILKFFENDLLDLEIIDPNQIKERQALYLSFSTLIREFKHKNLDNIEALEFAENQSLVFDTLVERHEGISNQGLQMIIDQLQERIGKF